MTRSTPDWLHLADDEAVVWESRPHPVTMGVRLPVALLVVFVGVAVAGWAVAEGAAGYVAVLGGLVALGGVIVALVQYVLWTNTRYVITSAELYKKRGIVSRDVTQFRIDRVQNTSLEQDVIGRLLGYGDLTIYTAGSGDPELTFERTPRPGRASSALNEQLGTVVDSSRARTA